MGQMPTPARCTVLPLTEQAPLAANATGRPELAVAMTVKSGSPPVLFASGANVIDCAVSTFVNVTPPPLPRGPVSVPPSLLKVRLKLVENANAHVDTSHKPCCPE